MVRVTKCQALTGLALFLASLLACQQVLAGSFSVSPTRLTLTAQQTSGMLTVRNTSDEETVVQLQANTWSQQADGSDVLEASSDLLAVPPLFTLKPGASQVVRVGLRRAPAAEGELTYRLLLREVPPPPADGFNGLQVALNLSLPVFVLPPQGAAPDLVWRMQYSPEGEPQLQLSNRGNAHAQVRKVGLTGPDGTEIEGENLPVYLLPGKSRSWPLAPDLATGPWILKADTDAGDTEAELVLEAR